jgi:hypothetical protein
MAAAWATCTKKLSALSCQPSARTGAPLLADFAGSGAFRLCRNGRFRPSRRAKRAVPQPNDNSELAVNLNSAGIRVTRAANHARRKRASAPELPPKMCQSIYENENPGRRSPAGLATLCVPAQPAEVWWLPRVRSPRLRRFSRRNTASPHGGRRNFAIPGTLSAWIPPSASRERPRSLRPNGRFGRCAG